MSAPIAADFEPGRAFLGPAPLVAVAPLQVWASTDHRDRGRTARVVAVDPAGRYADAEIVNPGTGMSRAIAAGRRVRLPMSRFGIAQWRRVEGAPA